MKILLFVSLFAVSACVCAQESHSSGGDSNPYKEFGITIEEKQAISFAKDIIEKLVDHNKLAHSWNTSEHVASNKKVFKNEPEWMVSFNNKEEIR